jgi:hypothetical protein
MVYGLLIPLQEKQAFEEPVGDEPMDPTNINYWVDKIHRG